MKYITEKLPKEWTGMLAHMVPLDKYLQNKFDNEGKRAISVNLFGLNVVFEVDNSRTVCSINLYNYCPHLVGTRCNYKEHCLYKISKGSE